MADNRDEQGRQEPDYRRGYYDREGRWVEYRDLGRTIRERIERRAQRDCRGHGPGTQGVVVAVVFIVVGVVFFLDNIGLFHFHDIFRFWPVALMAFGIAKLLDSRGPGAQVFASIWILVGGAFLLNNLGIWEMRWGTVWPLAIVLLGIVMLIHALDHQHAPEGPVMGSSEGTTSDKTLREWATFGGVKRRVDTNDFQGGEMVAVFGGIEIDLRRASIAPGTKEVVIDANATFGGIELRVPENWIVIMRGIGVFGGYEDKTIPPRESDRATAPRLVIKGYAVFGGVSIQN